MKAIYVWVDIYRNVNAYQKVNFIAQSAQMEEKLDKGSEKKCSVPQIDIWMDK